MPLCSHFDEFIEQFKVEHAKSAFPLGPVIQIGDGQIPDSPIIKQFLESTIGSGKKPLEFRFFDYRLDKPYRICSIDDPVLQFVAFDLTNGTYIFWSDSQPDGIHPAAAQARIFDREGMEVELQIGKDNSSVMTLYHKGKITKIEDNHKSGNRRILIDGVDLFAGPVIGEND
jgi:hypothetical protein